MKTVVMMKLDPQGKEVWRYPASLVYEDETRLELLAPFNGREADLMGTLIRPGDIFKEIFYKDRWYNIFAIHDRQDGTLKGWYCNIGMPVVKEAEGMYSYIDLALDIWVDQNGNLSVLDEEEFYLLSLEPGVRERAISALDELKLHLQEKKLLQDEFLQE